MTIILTVDLYTIIPSFAWNKKANSNILFGRTFYYSFCSGFFIIVMKKYMTWIAKNHSEYELPKTRQMDPNRNSGEIQSREGSNGLHDMRREMKSLLPFRMDERNETFFSGNIIWERREKHESVLIIISVISLTLRIGSLRSVRARIFHDKKSFGSLVSLITTEEDDPHPTEMILEFATSWGWRCEWLLPSFHPDDCWWSSSDVWPTLDDDFSSWLWWLLIPVLFLLLLLLHHQDPYQMT